jgi:hypothetical protein
MDSIGNHVIVDHNAPIAMCRRNFPKFLGKKQIIVGDWKDDKIKFRS